MNEQKKLKPVVYTTSYYKKGAPNKIQQNILLKAMQVTSDPKKLKDMIGVRTVAEVYRTLDKLAIRKEYHEALVRNGVSLDWIIDGIKNIAMSGYKDGDRIKALQIFLKSLGMDKYEAIDGSSGGTWEETLLKAIQEEKESTTQNLLSDVNSTEVTEEEEDLDYDVVHPAIPDEIKKKQDETIELTKDIYD